MTVLYYSVLYHTLFWLTISRRVLRYNIVCNCNFDLLGPHPVSCLLVFQGVPRYHNWDGGSCPCHLLQVLFSWNMHSLTYNVHVHIFICDAKTLPAGCNPSLEATNKQSFTGIYVYLFAFKVAWHCDILVLLAASIWSKLLRCSSAK